MEMVNRHKLLGLYSQTRSLPVTTAIRAEIRRTPGSRVSFRARGKDLDRDFPPGASRASSKEVPMGSPSEMWPPID